MPPPVERYARPLRRRSLERWPGGQIWTGAPSRLLPPDVIDLSANPTELLEVTPSRRMLLTVHERLELIISSWFLSRDGCYYDGRSSLVTLLDALHRPAWNRIKGWLSSLRICVSAVTYRKNGRIEISW